nr:unnamed protein product [Callosobruchus chinensis]
MGGVDLLDRVIGKYAMMHIIRCLAMRNRTNKWTIRTIYHFVDFAVAAGWLEYRENAKTARLPKKEVMDCLEFKLSVAKSLVATNEDEHSMEVEDFEAEVQPIPDKRSRKSGNVHLVEFMKSTQKTRSRCRFNGCDKLTLAKCKSYGIYLCCNVERNCFLQFHQ